jgi:hypothetical protein
MWYMLKAVQDHEDVHLSHFLPQLKLAAPGIETIIDGLSVPTASGKTQAQAIAEIKALPAYAAALTSGRTVWFNILTPVVIPDHSGPTDVAEHKVVDPMIAAICAAAKANGWGACAACPP